MCSKSTRGLSLHQHKTPVYRFSGFSFCLMRKGDQRRPSQGRPITVVLSFSRENHFNSLHMQPATPKFERRESHSNTTREFGNEDGIPHWLTNKDNVDVTCLIWPQLFSSSVALVPPFFFLLFDLFIFNLRPRFCSDGISANVSARRQKDGHARQTCRPSRLVCVNSLLMECR